jgi:hypothetical protein
MADDNKELIGQTQTGAVSKTTTKAAAKKSTAKTASKATKTSPAPAEGVKPDPIPAPETSKVGDQASTDPNLAPEAPAAGDPKGADPSPEFRGKSPEDISGKTTPKAPAEKPASGAKGGDDAFTKLAKEYALLYPGNKTFHITSDRQVFLEKDKGLADLHQRGLKDGKVTTVKVD